MLQTKKKQKKVCPIEDAGIKHIDYKDIELLKKYLTKFNRIIPRKYSGTKLRNQKNLARAIKQARFMALLPYVIDPRMHVQAAAELAAGESDSKAKEIDTEKATI